MTKEYMFLVYRWVKSFQNSGSIFSQKIQETTINTFISLLISAVVPYIIVIATGFYRSIKQIKGIKSYEEY